MILDLGAVVTALDDVEAGSQRDEVTVVGEGAHAPHATRSGNPGTSYTPESVDGSEVLRA